MITYDNLAAVPGTVALAPASIWIAAIILAALAGVILVRLYRKRSTPTEHSTDILEEQFWLDIIFGVDKSSEPEKPHQKRGPENLP